MTSILDTIGERNAARLGLGLAGGIVLVVGLDGMEHDRAAAIVVPCLGVGVVLLLAAVFGAQEVSLGPVGGIKLGSHPEVEALRKEVQNVQDHRVRKALDEQVMLLTGRLLSSEDERRELGEMLAVHRDALNARRNGREDESERWIDHWWTRREIEPPTDPKPRPSTKW